MAVLKLDDAARRENCLMGMVYGEAVAEIQQFYMRRGLDRWAALAKAREMFERARRHHLKTGNARTMQDDLTKYFEVSDLLTWKLGRWGMKG